ncbi:MAG: glycosyltransferase family 2 protein [Pseudomonadota bacterium]
MLIASLSSIPPRFGDLGATLSSLLGQARRPDRIVLSIPRAYRRFPDWNGVLPEVPAGVEIIRAADFGPATKLLGLLRDGAPEGAQILFCDDDRIYDPLLTTRVLTEAEAHPECAIAENGYHLSRYGFTLDGQRQPRAVRRMRVTDWRFQLAYAVQDMTNWARRKDLREPPRRCNKRAGFVDVFEGSGGVLVRPEMFDEAVFDIPDVAWSVDDIWLSGQLERQGVPIWLPANILEQRFSAAERAAPLSGQVNDADKNRRAVAHMQAAFGVWR